jgi:hypothetical protein
MIAPRKYSMTTRTSRAVRTGLRRIISDPETSRGMRMKAIQLLLAVEGVPSVATGKTPEVKSSANQRRLRELLEETRNGKSMMVSPGASVLS